MLVALGVDLAADKEIVTLIPGGEERKDAWLTLLTDLTTRGVQAVDRFIRDGGERLLAALANYFPRSARQRCITHNMRTVFAHGP